MTVVVLLFLVFPFMYLLLLIMQRNSVYNIHLFLPYFPSEYIVHNVYRSYLLSSSASLPHIGQYFHFGPSSFNQSILQGLQIIIQSPGEKRSLSISFLLSYLVCSPLMLTVLTLLLFGPIFCFVQSSWSHHKRHYKVSI